MSRHLGPPLEDPPTSPPRCRTGAPWGERGGLHRRSGYARVGSRSNAQTTATGHPLRRHCDRRATERSEWRGGRAAAGLPCSSGPASGVAGDRGDDLTGAAPSAAKLQRPASRSVRQAGVVHAQREGNGARDPRARERAAVVIAPATPAWLCCARDGSPWGRDAGRRTAARREAQQPGPAQRDAPVESVLMQALSATDRTLVSSPYRPIADIARSVLGAAKLPIAEAKGLDVIGCRSAIGAVNAGPRAWVMPVVLEFPPVLWAQRRPARTPPSPAPTRLNSVPWRGDCRRLVRSCGQRAGA